MTYQYLILANSQQRSWNVECLLWTNVPVSAQVETVDEYYTLPPSLQQQQL